VEGRNEDRDLSVFESEVDAQFGRTDDHFSLRMNCLLKRKDDEPQGERENEIRVYLDLEELLQCLRGEPL